MLPAGFRLCPKVAHMIPSLILTLKSDREHRLHLLLQRGCFISLAAGDTLMDFLCSLPGFDRQYVLDRVQTIFVNGRAEDDLERPLMAGDSLSVSGPMPGLAGAIFRRESRHDSLRTRSRPSRPRHPARQREIFLKLFNVIAAEKGAALLARGVVFKGTTLARAFDRQAELLRPLVREAMLNGSPLEYAALAAESGQHERIFLQVRG